MATCLTVDVEDWYDGMAQVGHVFSPSRSTGSGLAALTALLSTTAGAEHARLTFFVVGKYVGQVRDELHDLAAGGHELASHGPDHGAPPEEPRRLEHWLRQGREMVEDVAQHPVTGFRSPRFAVPQSMSLEQYREVLARSGFGYVSDRHRLGAGSPVRELPVFTWRGVPLGGGSYQRLAPKVALRPLLEALAAPAGADPATSRVLYYHSYDFGVALPPLGSSWSPAVLKQTLGRSRIPTIFRHVLATAGSVSCNEVVLGV